MSPPFPHLRLDRPLALIDLETTSLSVAAARIIDIAVVRLAPGDRPQQFAIRLNPGVTIAPDATEVHGIRDRDVRAKPPFARVARHLLGLLANADLAGFNVVGYDLPVLANEFRRAGRPLPLAGRAVVDVFHLFKRQEPRDLAAAVRFYLGRDHHRAHSARADVWATAEVLNAQLARYPELPARPADLHRLLVDVDIARKFKRGVDGQVALGFGKYAGVPLAAVAARDPGYLRWMLTTDLLDAAAELVRRALAGQFPEVVMPAAERD